jgi:hypothetical protein
MKLRTLLLVAVLAAPALAQQDPNLEIGLKPYGSFHGGEIDTISLSTGNLSLQAPLLSYPQRGNLGLGFMIRYNNKAWQKVQTSLSPIHYAYQW